MSRLEKVFSQCAAQNEAALIAYICTGHPSLKSTVPAMHALVEAGADVIELGVPFSDPMADGPVIQKAAEKAIENGADLSHVLEAVRNFRATDATTPVVLMGYMNPIERMGYLEFAKEAHAHGADGVLVVDLPLEEGDGLRMNLAQEGLDPIMLVAPTTSAERAARIAAKGQGFLYYVSFKGITGSAALNVDPVREHLAEIRQQVSLPIAVGFGVKTPDQACALSQFSDGVVVGSAIVSAIDGHQDVADIRNRIQEIVVPLKAATKRS